jgi:ABC-type transport system substrate-binding protein
LTCNSYRPRYTENTNAGGFCDARVDALIARAGKLQTSDPAAARRLWTTIDAEMVDRAALVPLVNSRLPVFLSARAGNFHYGTEPIWEQLWVR